MSPRKQPPQPASNAARQTPETAGAQRLPPQDLGAEVSVLGSLIIDRDCIGDVIQLLGPDCFYQYDHQLIYDAISALFENNRPVDLVTVRDELAKRNRLETIGGVDYLVRLVEAVPSAANAAYYANIVLEKALLRCLIRATNEINTAAYDAVGDPAELLEEAEKKIFEVTEKKIVRQATDMRSIISQVYASLENRTGHYVTGLPTGYHELDEMTCGLQPGEMLIIAARPSMGKTALGLNIAEHVAADNGVPVAIFSLEMSAQMLAERMLAGRSHIDSQKLRRGMLNDQEYETLGRTAGGLSEAPLYVDDSSGLTPLELRAKARRLKMMYDIQLIVIDYLQLMHAPGVDNRAQEVGLISRQIKAVARELNIPVIAMAQLNRGPEGREGHRPRMSDLRESGNIEQDADVVMLLHREGYYRKKKTAGEEDSPFGGGDDGNGVDDNAAEIIIEKQRNGPTGTVELVWIPQWTRFENKSSAPDFGV